MTGYRIGIDTGGTFTDGFVSKTGGGFVWAKTLTTPYDLGECFRHVLEDLATRLGVTTEEMLRGTEFLAYSTTHGTNTLLERSGPRLGLIVSEGMTELIDREHFFVPKDAIAEVAEEVSERGEVVRAVSDEEIRSRGEALSDAGIRGLVVAFRNSALNPENEEKAKAVLDAINPDHSFGWIPIFISTDLSLEPDDLIRLTTAVVSAYIHAPLADFLYPLEQELRNKYLQRPLLVANGAGGLARVAKSTALNTFQSGPACGAIGSSILAQSYGWDDVLSVDMGGTSTDITWIGDRDSLIGSGYWLDGVRLDGAVVDVRSIATGGSSIVSVVDGAVQIGPRSAGARPGPACFDLGGDLPTVTDADVVLGIFDPDYFRGGQLHLNADRARAAIDEHVARRLGIDVEQAAVRIHERLEIQAAEAIRGAQPDGRHLENFILFSYGGAGPTHSHGYASRLGIRRIAVFPFASVLSAFGCVISDIAHRYSVGLTPALRRSGPEGIVQQIRSAQERALEDMRLEGFEFPQVVFRFWADIEEADDGVRRWVPIAASDPEEVVREVGDTSDVRAVIVEGVIEVPKIDWKPGKARGKKVPTEASKGKRDVYFDGRTYASTIYDAVRLSEGSRLEGPAVIESEFTSCVVPPGATLTVDRYGTALMDLA